MDTNLAVVGLGRIGALHALHAKQVAGETPGSRLVALVDEDLARAHRLADDLTGSGSAIAVFPSIDALLESGLANAAIVCTPTVAYQEHAGNSNMRGTCSGKGRSADTSRSYRCWRTPDQRRGGTRAAGGGSIVYARNVAPDKRGSPGHPTRSDDDAGGLRVASIFQSRSEPEIEN